MQVKKNQIFNLMDTNGRRNDVINALQGYISILDDIINREKCSWNPVPKSLAQFNFYQRAIELSPDVFKQHEHYDNLMKEIQKNPQFKEAIENGDMKYITKFSFQYANLLNKFDKNIEDRARHYTSNLVKLGFVDGNRNISEVGELLLNPTKLKKDELEKTLPIDNVNIIYLRQLLKLKVFDEDGKNYYSPFNMALYMLLSNERIAESRFLEIIQGSNPYTQIKEIDEFIDNYKNGDIINNLKIDVPEELQTENLIEEEFFRKKFKNQKSQKQVDVYWKYYNLLYCFNKKRDANTLQELLTFSVAQKDVLKKAFGGGKNIFVNPKGAKIEPEEFIQNNKEIFTENLNEYLYKIFVKSKQLDSIHEYSDTTKRIFKATGIISFDHGYVELAYKELLRSIFKKSYFRDNILGEAQGKTNGNYEKDSQSFFGTANSLSQILELEGEDVDNVIDEIKTEFEQMDIEEIANLIVNKRKQEFVRYIDEVYPLEKVKKILSLFRNRENDETIKNMVSTEATVPTIYEYIVGIAWYYFSGKKIDLLGSYNLTLSANFEPLVHAGGGQGDIVIYEKDKVVMLEATLMNSNTQKRGEWEPVLRHSINLKIEEELNSTSRNVTSFFIADNFDANTINIWKAVATVPLQSSIYKDKFTNHVMIMPINNVELGDLMDKSSEYDEIISKVRALFEVDKTSFDMDWRNKFMKQVIK